jgi:hypothetical protein
MIAKLMKSLLTLGTGGSESSSKNQPSNSSGLKEEEGYYTWKKGDCIVLSKYFNTKEFTCRCNFPDCPRQRISKALITKLDNIRIEVKQPIIITSGFRCTKYQAFLRASGVNSVVAKASTHELGNAADIVPEDGHMQGFESICAKQFDSIGIAKNFLHVDTRIGKRRWNY